MKRYLFLIIAIIGFFSVSAQTFTWIDGEETGYDLNPSMVNYTTCSSPDGAIWFGGLKEKVTSYYLMMGKNILIRYDEQGSRSGTYMIDGTLVIKAMKCDPAGNLFIAGDFLDQDIHFWDGTIVQWDGNSINSFIARVNSQGTVDWGVNLNTALGEYAPVSDMAYANGQMYLAHDIWQGPFISSISNSGDPTVFITQTNVGILSGIDFDTNGNLYCTGSCAGTNSLFNGISFPPSTFYNKYMVKYNASGIPEWVKYSEDVTCILPKVRVDRNNDVYWTGQLFVSSVFDTLTLEGPSWVYDFYLVKLNPQGNALWGREVPQVMTGDATTGSLDIIKVMPDNSVTLGGVTRGMVDWGNGVVSNTGSMNQGAWLLNYDSEGMSQWTKTVQGDFTDLKSMDTDLTGNLYFTGIGHDTIWFDNLNLYRTTFYYPYLVKLENPATGLREKTEAHHIILVPNPARDFITILPEGLVSGKVEIVDLYGKVVLQFRKENRMNISSLSSGVYFVRYKMGDGSEGREKLVVS
jgi:hypothetical protein